MPRRYRKDPFKPGLAIEERRERLVGRVLKVDRDGLIERLIVTDLVGYNEETGGLRLFAARSKIERRGQYRSILRSEIVSVK